MSYDFYVPDHYFDKEQLRRRKDNEQATEKYIVPLQTFWRPIHIDEYYETDMKNQKFIHPVRPMENID